jgi:hypothetical protein
LQGKRELAAREKNQRKKKRCGDEGCCSSSFIEGLKGVNHLAKQSKAKEEAAVLVIH